LLIALAQRTRRFAALAFNAAAVAGHITEFLAHALEATFGFATVLLRVRPRHRQHAARHGRHHHPRQHPARDRAHPLATSRLSPVISAGLSIPSRSSIVGARSRNAPPRRSVAARLPT